MTTKRIDWEKLRREAEKVRALAYAPYSKFSVGAAILGAGGKMFVGCNVENRSYSMTCCAERAAVFAAVAGGERDFSALALATSGESPATPCGACLQALAEFSSDLEIQSFSKNGTGAAFQLRELLPLAFQGPDNVPRGT